MPGYLVEGRLFHKTVLLKLLPENLHKFLNELGISVNVCEIFFTPPHSQQFIHRDSGDYQRETMGGEHELKSRSAEMLSYQAKLNWCYDELGGITFNNVPSMNWWATNEMPANYKYDPDLCTLLETATIYQPSLIRVDLPHNAFNSTNLGRWCISLSLGKITGGPLLWEDAVKLLAPQIT